VPEPISGCGSLARTDPEAEFRPEGRTKMPDANDANATIRYITGLQNTNGGFSPGVGTEPTIPATIPATLAAVRVLKYLRAEIPNLKQTQAFISSCLDSNNGGIKYFPDDASKTDVYSTSVGTLALMDLKMGSVGICNDILVYLDGHTQNDFLNTYFAAFAWEAIGVGLPNMPMPSAIADRWISTIDAAADDGGTYGGSTNVAATAEAVAAKIRLGQIDPFEGYIPSAKFLQESQNPDGGYPEFTGSESSVVITYEIMRAFDQLNSIVGQVCPLDPDGVTKFVASCGNSDGGYGDPPNDPLSAANPTYFAISALHILEARCAGR
jgi:prenyltransferase beta subunit